MSKQLLIIDLLPRIAYGVKALVCSGVGKGSIISIKSLTTIPVCYVSDDRGNIELLENIKPCLFPLESLTEEQIKDFNDSHEISLFFYKDVIHNINEFGNLVYTELKDCLCCINWLNSFHIDYRDLIKKGLAIDATNLNIY